MSIILTVAPNLLKGRVELERIHIFPIFGEEKNIRKFQILTVVALNQQVGIMFLTLLSTATRDFWSIIRQEDFARLDLRLFCYLRHL